ncbi:hypothetical protein P7K49_026721, partial [Saguinus oedipus]
FGSGGAWHTSSLLLVAYRTPVPRAGNRFCQDPSLLRQHHHCQNLLLASWSSLGAGSLPSLVVLGSGPAQKHTHRSRQLWSIVCSRYRWQPQLVTGPV